MIGISIMKKFMTQQNVYSKLNIETLDESGKYVQI